MEDDEMDFLERLIEGGRQMAKRTKVLAGMDHCSTDKPAVPSRAMQSRPAVRVECPSEGDVIALPSYTFKIAATSGVEAMEVSIDQGDWVPCREAAGFWWYDWSGFDKGEHELAARSRLGGVSANSGPRLFTVN
jgi:hypothetical protein